MLKFLTATVAAAALLVVTQATSEAAGRRRCASAPSYQAAAPASASAAAVAGAPTGYRSFSYEPGTSAYGAGMTRSSSSSRPSYLDASSKALGRYGK